MASRQDQIKALEKDWAENPRWANLTRTYSAEDVVRLRGSVRIHNCYPWCRKTMGSS